MDNLNLIAAIGNNNELGKDNKLLWNIKEDMKFFKNTTSGHTVIMGRKTFESIGKALPNRINVVITNNKNLSIPSVIVLNSKDEVLKYIEKSSDECFIIGGANIYKMFIDYCKHLYITHVESSFDADAFFPKINESDYTVESLGNGSENNIVYKFKKYTKRY